MITITDEAFDNMIIDIRVAAIMRPSILIIAGIEIALAAESTHTEGALRGLNTYVDRLKMIAVTVGNEEVSMATYNTVLDELELYFDPIYEYAILTGLAGLVNWVRGV